MAKSLEQKTQDLLGQLHWAVILLQQRLDESDEKLADATQRAERAEQDLAQLRASQSGG